MSSHQEPTVTASPPIKLGSIWRERDKRVQRRVKVIGDGSNVNAIRLAPGYEEIAVRIGSIVIVTIDGQGNRVGRIQYAKPERFNGRAHGYAIETNPSEV